MRKALYIMAVSIVLLLAAETQYGQSAPSSKVTIDVPFTFVAGGKLLPPGDYDVIERSIDDPYVVQLVGPGPLRVSVLTRLIELSSISEGAKVVFKTNGRQMVLHQVTMTGSSHLHDVLHETGIPEP